ncbi:MAG: glutamyl-tRNA reductase [Desulfovibrio sp.]|jgi:glutamyl-tRNA reductase|nr:glutamyl-tRNA reductase [Desulfovibrio sp.]
MDRCTIQLVGLNHRTAGVDIRERFALANHCTRETWAVPCTAPVAEALILSTCNRVEVLTAGPADMEEAVLAAWAASRGAPVRDLAPYVYIHKDLDAVKHVFTVASSLDSMVLGEPQILGQLKAAYRAAVESRCTGTILNRLLHRAFSVAKRVRTETAIAANAVSVSYAAVELAKRIFGDMVSRKALLVGAGEMAELAATHLLQAGLRELMVANRTRSRGEALARQFKGRAIDFQELEGALAEADIVITSTGSPEPLIRARDVRQVLKRRKNSPMFFIDIAVPRDVDPDVNGLDNVYLYDIDDLREVVEENLAQRRNEAVRAAAIIGEEVGAFDVWLRGLDVQPTVVALIDRGRRIAGKELDRTLKRLGPVGEEQRKALEDMLEALLSKLHHDPIMYMKCRDATPETCASRIETVRDVFGLE